MFLDVHFFKRTKAYESLHENITPPNYFSYTESHCWGFWAGFGHDVVTTTQKHQVEIKKRKVFSVPYNIVQQ